MIIYFLIGNSYTIKNQESSLLISSCIDTESSLKYYGMLKMYFMSNEKKENSFLSVEDFLAHLTTHYEIIFGLSL